jgi:hypothetical protein
MVLMAEEPRARARSTGKCPEARPFAVGTVEGEGSYCFHSKQDRILALVVYRQLIDLCVRVTSHPFTTTPPPSVPVENKDNSNSNAIN